MYENVEIIQKFDVNDEIKIKQCTPYESGRYELSINSGFKKPIKLIFFFRNSTVTAFFLCYYA